MANEVDRYIRYYISRSQKGGDIGPFYRASHFKQKGHGLGSFFGGLWRYVKPFFTSGLRAVGEEALKAGSSALSDIGTKTGREILRTRFGEAGRNLKRRAEEKLKRMEGAGLRTAKRPRIAKNIMHFQSPADVIKMNVGSAPPRRRRRVRRQKKKTKLSLKKKKKVQRKKRRKKGSQRGGSRDIFS